MAFLAEEALAHLERSHARKRLAHAYLVTGPAGSGKERFALSLLRMLNGIQADRLESLRDDHFFLVKPESKLRRIKVDQIRQLERALHFAARPGTTKVVVISGADRLQRESENAFLKTLEEPPAGSLLLLLTAQPEQLLDTVRSRCIRVALRPPPGQGVILPEIHRKFLAAVARYFEKNQPTHAAGLSMARGFTAILRAEREEVTKEAEATLKGETQRYGQTTDGSWLKHRETFYKDHAESEYALRRSALVESLLYFFGDVLRQNAGLKSLDLPEFDSATRIACQRFSPRDLQGRFDALETLRTHLETTVQDQLAVEVAFLRVFGPGR